MFYIHNADAVKIVIFKTTVYTKILRDNQPMVNIVPITKSQFLDRKWSALDNYKFAEEYATATLALGEISQGMRSFPIGFVKNENYFTLVAILGLQPGENLFINKKGEWIPGYRPAVLRSYPFSLIPGANDQVLLAFDEDSLSYSNVAPTNLFYDENGEIVDEVSRILSFLGEVHTSYSKTLQICEIINNYDLFEKWDISITRGNKVVQVDGIYKIDENKLYALDGDALKNLQNVSGLGMIYGHIFSGSHISLLEKLANFRDTTANSEQANIESVEELFSYEDEDTIDFSSL